MRADSEQDYVEFVTARLPALRRLAWLLCGDEHRGDDLVQQAITSLYVRWPRMETVANPDQYVRRMLINAFLDERRRAWSRVRLLGDLPEPPPADAPGVEDRELLRAALAKVPPKQRAVLVLRFLCDLPVAEVADIVNCSVGTVKSQTSHGLANLRRLLADSNNSDSEETTDAVR